LLPLDLLGECWSISETASTKQDRTREGEERTEEEDFVNLLFGPFRVSPGVKRQQN